MTDRKNTNPLVETPVRVDVSANATASLEKATNTAAHFVERVVIPPAEAVAGLAVDIIDFLRGPFKLARLNTLSKLSKRVMELRDEQGVTEPLPLPPKSTHVVIEQGSFEEDDALRELWAQLIVNAQAGMETTAYLFEVLSKLTADDVALLRKADDMEGQLRDISYYFGRVVAEGLMTDEYEVVVLGPPRSLNSTGELKFVGYRLTELGEELLGAVRPRPQPASG